MYPDRCSHIFMLGSISFKDFLHEKTSDRAAGDDELKGDGMQMYLAQCPLMCAGDEDEAVLPRLSERQCH